MKNVILEKESLATRRAKTDQHQEILMSHLRAIITRWKLLQLKQNLPKTMLDLLAKPPPPTHHLIPLLTSVLMDDITRCSTTVSSDKF